MDAVQREDAVTGAEDDDERRPPAWVEADVERDSETPDDEEDSRPLVELQAPPITFRPLDRSDAPHDTAPSEESPARGERDRLDARLASLERRMAALAQAGRSGGNQSETSPSDGSRSSELERATRLLQQMQQNTRIQDLERQLRDLTSQMSRPEASSPRRAPPAGAPPPRPRKPVSIVEAKIDGDAETFSIQVDDADVRQVLQSLGRLAGKNVVATPNVSGEVSLNLQQVTVDEAITAVLQSHGLVLEQKDDFLYVTTAEEDAQRRRAERKIVTKVYRPNYISVTDLQTLVAPLLTEGIGKIAVTSPSEVGIKSDAENAGGDNLTQRDALLVQDYDDVVAEIDKVLLEMDVPPAQVVIEAMILSVRLTDEMKFGVNFALLGKNGKDLFTSGNGRVLNNSSGFPGTSDSILPATGQFLADVAGLKYGFVRGDMSLFVDALETIADTNLIAAPQVRVLNKQKAELIIGQKLSYTTQTFNATQTIENVNFLDVGTKLILRPFVSEDGMVRMEVHPERSSATINQTTQLPDVDTTEVTSNIMVRDGSTIVIGGLIEETVTQSEQRVPFLGALPLVGKAFTNQNDTTDRFELIVLITPRIVREPHEMAAGEVARYEGQRRHDYFKEHLAPVNRLNLMRIHRERAERHLHRGELLRAKYHAREALRIHENDLPTLRLLDQIEAALRSEQKRWFGIPLSKRSARARRRRMEHPSHVPRHPPAARVQPASPR